MSPIVWRGNEGMVRQLLFTCVSKIHEFKKKTEPIMKINVWKLFFLSNTCVTGWEMMDQTRIWTQAPIISRQVLYQLSNLAPIFKLVWPSHVYHHTPSLICSTSKTLQSMIRNYNHNASKSISKAKCKRKKYLAEKKNTPKLNKLLPHTYLRIGDNSLH